MIPRPSAASHICLSCRRALAKQNLSTRTFATRSGDSKLHVTKKHRPQTQTDNTWLAREVINLKKARVEKERRERLEEEYLHKKVITELGGIDERRFDVLEADDRSKIFGRTGQKKREDVEDLGLPLLGEDGKVVVLRDSVLSKYYTSQQMLPQEAEHIDILGQIDEERGLVGPKEVEANIDMLKPAPGHQMYTWEEVSELVGKIQLGFTTPQLERYIKDKTVQPSEPAPLALPPKTRHVIKIATPWRPGISKVEHAFDNDPLRGYVLDSYTRKQKVILKLLIECWQIEALEIIDGIGQFEVFLDARDLELLLDGQPSALDKLCNDRLDLEGEKLEVFRSRNVVRVATSGPKRAWILEGVQELLNAITKEKIALGNLVPRGSKGDGLLNKSWVKQTFDDRTMQEITKIVQIKIDKLVGKMHDTYEVAGWKRGPNDKRWDTVRRLLMVPSTIVDRVQQHLATDAPTGGLFIPYTLVDGLNWWARLRTWTRWTAPILKGQSEIDASNALAFPFGKPSGSLGLVSLTSKSDLKHGPTAFPNQAVLLEQRKSGSLFETTESLEEEKKVRKAQLEGPWGNRYFTKTSATFGAVLHGYNSDSKAHLWELERQKYAPKDSHEFSTHVPNLSRFINNTTHIVPPQPSPAELEALRAQGPRLSLVEPKHSLILRFKADPFAKARSKSIGGAAFVAFPEIEMHFSNDPGQKRVLRGVYAIVDEHRTDVMLPQEAVDVRFSQRTTSRWKGSVGVLREYMQQCDLDSPRSKLEIHPTIMLPISADLCRGQGLKLMQPQREPPNKQVKDMKSDPRKVMDVPYVFVGLEFRKQIVVKYQKWTVMYTNIEAGKSGGVRGELTLRPIVDGEVASEEEFVKMAYKIVGVIGGVKSDDDMDKVVRMVRDRREIQRTRVRRIETDKANPPTYFSQSIFQEEEIEDPPPIDYEDLDVWGKIDRDRPDILLKIRALKEGQREGDEAIELERDLKPDDDEGIEYGEERKPGDDVEDEEESRDEGKH